MFKKYNVLSRICKMSRVIATLLVTVCLIACQKTNTNTGIKSIRHVVVVGIDGLSPDGIAQAHTPIMDELMATGASTMLARGVMPTSSGPNWASILMGAGPEQHGITGNDYAPDEPSLPPVVSGTGNRRLFPTIFELLHKEQPDRERCAIYHWETIASYYDPDHVTFISEPGSDAGVAEVAAEHFRENQPVYCFLHFDDVDQAGHSFGHGSPLYYKSVERADGLLGQVINALDASGLREHTLVVVTSDHGGMGFGHNEAIPEVIGIPFIMNGPGVKRGYMIRETVSTIDNAPTVAFVLGLQPPEAWTGWPVKSAFQGYEPTGYLLDPAVFYRKPAIYPETSDFGNAGGLYIAQQARVVMANRNASGVIRHTLDGTDPTAESPVYKTPFFLDRTTVVKAAVFENGARQTNVNTAYFRVLTEPANHGVYATFYYGSTLDSLPDFSLLKPVESNRKAYEFTSEGLAFPDGPDQLAVAFTSYLKIDQAGTYTFTTASDDGSKLHINDLLVVDNDGNHGVRERHGNIELAPGFHRIKVTWYNSGGGLWLRTYIAGPNIPRQIIPPDRLYLQPN